MEVLTIIVIIFVGYLIISYIINALRKVAGVIALHSRFSKNFRVEISKTKKAQLDLDCFEIKIRGAINIKSDNKTVQFIAKMYDETDGKKEPVLSIVEQFQSDNSSTFYFSKSEKLSYANSLISKWALVVRIPLSFLQFPKKGERNINVVFYIADQQNNVLEKASHQISFFNKENGYLDLVENRKKIEKMIITTALLVSNSDNEMDSSEADIIKHWVKTKLTGYNESTREEHKQRLNSYIKKGFDEVKNNDIDISVLDNINNIASDGEKYELYELCVKVAGADKKARKEELYILKMIANLLNLDKGKLQLMQEKELPITIYTNDVDDKEGLVGIKVDMNNQQINEHLVKEYSKWNARVAHKDEEVRQQANEMIKIIIELKKKLKKKYK